MVLIREYRIAMPLTLDEYARGQLYTTAAFSKAETSGSEGIEVVKNEPYTDHPVMGTGQYTYKIYHLSSKVPAWVRMIAPNGSLELHEESWNGFPKIKTVLTNKYMGDKFRIMLETFHTQGRTVLENALNLTPEILKKREIVNIDIAKDKIEAKDYVAEQDPTKVHSAKANRGPLVAGSWQAASDPYMMVYKVFTAEFRVMGLQDRVESFIHKTNHNLITLFHRKLFCFLDQYYDMTIADIRAYEERVKQEMLATMATGKEKDAAAHKHKPKSSTNLTAGTHTAAAPAPVAGKASVTAGHGDGKHEHAHEHKHHHEHAGDHKHQDGAAAAEAPHSHDHASDTKPADTSAVDDAMLTEKVEAVALTENGPAVDDPMLAEKVEAAARAEALEAAADTAAAPTEEPSN